MNSVKISPKNAVIVVNTAYMTNTGLVQGLLASLDFG